MGDCLSHYEIVFYMTKNSIYGPAVSQVIEGLKEAGITDKLVKDGTGAARVRTTSAGQDNSLSLTAMQGPFAFLGLLLAAASVVILIEMLRGNRNYREHDH